MKILVIVCRCLLGLLFLVSGANGFLNFFPQPPPPPGLAGQYITVLFESHYLVLVFILQVLGGVLLLANRFVPLALVVLGPVIVNILMFHYLMDPGGLVPGVVALALWLVVFYRVRDAFTGIFTMRKAQ